MKELPEEMQDPIDSIGNERWVPILDDVEWTKNLDTREVEEIRLAYFYVQSPHGTAGHNRLLLIAKLADRLSTIEDVMRAIEVGEGDIIHGKQFREIVYALLGKE